MSNSVQTNGETLVFTCAGAAYSGQASNQAGVQLHREKFGNLFCIAAIAADRPEKMERARNAGTRIAIDGCEDHCCKIVLEKAGLPVDVHVVATDLGIEKKPETPRMAEDSARIVDEVKRSLTV
ncbi:MAG: putative zinc-binding protein [Candidatus Omnitrophica bacterium]|nr:putative zinc-binding protein [Candidatus Omnitrophota bacterium]